VSVVDDPAARPLLSAVVLCYRGGRDVLGPVADLHACLRASGVDFELVLVANYWPGADDVTPEVVADYARERPEVTVVAGPKQGGMGWDMRSGLAAARGDVIVVMDGDGQNPAEDVIRMYRLIAASGVDVAKGRRTTRGDGAYRALISRVYNLAFRVLFGTKGLSDINGKPKGLTRAAYARIGPCLRSDDWFADAELVLEARRHGLRIGELDVSFLQPTRPSFVRPSAILEFVVNMFAYRLRRRR
jgi:glycosyltransferase involved in cell wall biosynthesis